MTTTESTPPASSTERDDDGDRPEVSGAEIRLDGVTKRYPGQKAAAVDNLSLTIPAGEIVMFVGPADGRIVALDLKVLADDREFFPKYNVALVLTDDTKKKYPQSEDPDGTGHQEV